MKPAPPLAPASEPEARAEAERARLLGELELSNCAAEPALEAIARLVQAACRRPMAAVTLLDARRAFCIAAAGFDPAALSSDGSLCAAAMAAEAPLDVVDVQGAPRFAGATLRHDGEPVRAYAGVAVALEGVRLGAVCAFDVRPGALGPEGLAALREGAALVEALLGARLRERRSCLQEARVRGASRAGSDWLWESDADGRLTWVSESVEAHTGESPGQRLGRPVDEGFEPWDDEHRASWDARLAARANRLPFRDAIARAETPRGTLAIAINGDPLFDGAGRFTGYRGAARDVTETLAREAAERRARQTLLDAIERISAAVMVSDPHGRIVLSNAAARAQVRRFLPDHAPDTWDAMIRALVAAGAYPDAQGREEAFAAERLAMVSEDGVGHELRFGERQLLVSDQRLPDGSVVHLKIDITEHRRAELALAEQDTRLRALVSALPDLWLVIDADGRYLECGDEHHPLLARPFAELRGRRIEQILPPDIAARCMAGIRAALATGEVQRVEYLLRTLDGQEHSFESRIAPLAGGRTLYLVRDLTELRQLARDVQLLQRAMEAENALPMTVADATLPELPLVYVNTAFERLTGYARAEVLGRNCRFLQDGIADQPGLAALRAALAEARDCTVLLRNRRRDGSVFANELHVAPIRDAAGRVTHYIGVQSDVTERHRAAERLAYSEALYRSVAGAISDGLLVVDPEGRIVTLNPAACVLFERSAGELTGRVPTEIGFEVRHEDGRPLAPEDNPLHAVLREGRRIERTMLMLRPDRSRLLLQTSLQPLRFGAEDAPPYVVVTLRDIGAQRAAEAALAQAEARWKLALDGAGDGVWDYDEDTRVAFFSPTWKRMLGHEEHEVGATLEEWFSRIHPEDRERVIGALARYRAGAAPDYREHYRLRHRDGHWLWIDDFGHVVERREDGSARRLVGVHSDVTRQRQADQALRDKQAAELASRAKSEFLSRMSHEMRTPLNAVIGFTQLLRLQGGHDRHTLGQYSEHILAAGRHLLALVNDVLDLQQVEEGRLSLSPAPLWLHEALEEALELTRPLARPRGIELRSEVPTGVRVRADGQRLRQVLLNVLSNGVKYNRDAGMLRCALEAGAAGGCVLLIEDSGHGLSRQQLARLFQPFERLGLESSGIEGSGLGLIIARQLMREMHGNLRINSRPGLGTQVRLDLVLAEDDAAAPAAPPGEAPTTTGWTENLAALPARPADVPVLRLLYVEDNRINALLFEEAIKLRGDVELRVVEDGDEALELVAHWTPDVLVLDAHLPGMSGYELLRALRRIAALEETPAFMCSADAMPDDVQRAHAAGFAGYWTKPIDIARVMKDLDDLRLQTTAG